MAHPVLVRLKKGDPFVRDFCKMTQEKRHQRDLNEEKEFRKEQATCSYEELANNLVADRGTQKELAPKMSPNEIIGIIFCHSRFRECQLTALQVSMPTLANSVWDYLDFEEINDDSVFEKKYAYFTLLFLLSLPKLKSQPRIKLLF